MRQKKIENLISNLFRIKKKRKKKLNRKINMWWGSNECVYRSFRITLSSTLCVRESEVLFKFSSEEDFKFFRLRLICINPMDIWTEYFVFLFSCSRCVYVTYGKIRWFSFQLCFFFVLHLFCVPFPIAVNVVESPPSFRSEKCKFVKKCTSVLIHIFGRHLILVLTNAKRGHFIHCSFHLCSFQLKRKVCLAK